MRYIPRMNTPKKKRGRPAVERASAMTYPLHVRVTEATGKRLEAEAEQRKVKVAVVVRERLEREA